MELAAAPQELSALAAMLWAWAVDFIPRFVGAAMVLVLGYLAAKWAARLASAFIARSNRIDNTYIPSIQTVIRYAILIFVGVAALSQLGVQTTSILAALGAAGLAIGLALQGTLSNIAAGIMLLWLRPFRAGEHIQVDTAEGTVREIGLFATLLDAPDGSFRFVPNAQLWNRPLANFTRNPRRLVELRITVGRRSGRRAGPADRPRHRQGRPAADRNSRSRGGPRRDRGDDHGARPARLVAISGLPGDAAGPPLCDPAHARDDRPVAAETGRRRAPEADDARFNE